jgi:RepB plasmid partitioning protein/ParB-like nuclease domain
MPRRMATSGVRMAFEQKSVRLTIADIQPLRVVAPNIKKTIKYARILASVGEVGVVEPPVVAPDRNAPGKYVLLDGHLRIEALKEMTVADVECLVSTDDEAFTYNKRVNRLAIIQEHRMILKAIEKGVSEERLARALNLDVKTLKYRKRLLHGICPEVIELLKDKHVPMSTFWVLKKMMPIRQIEAAEVMVAMNKYMARYARSLLAATPQAQLVEPDKPRSLRGLTAEQMALMERESANLEREFKMAEQSFGTDHLELVLAKGYLTKLLGNARVVRYLAQGQQEILTEFQKIVEMQSSAA